VNMSKVQSAEFFVAQTSKSAVPQVSKPAGIRTVPPTRKSAAQQVWKPALGYIRVQSGLNPTR
jgi:hypothetical protein